MEKETQQSDISNGVVPYSLRDYFAAKALMGICNVGTCTYEETAKEAYAYADAMLKAREGK